MLGRGTYRIKNSWYASTLFCTMVRIWLLMSVLTYIVMFLYVVICDVIWCSARWCKSGCARACSPANVSRYVMLCNNCLCCDMQLHVMFCTMVRIWLLTYISRVSSLVLLLIFELAGTAKSGGMLESTVSGVSTVVSAGSRVNRVLTLSKRRTLFSSVSPFSLA
jgi:hypothetical protein